MTGTKKIIFWSITVLLPFFLLAILEVSLRIGNYGGNLSLFIDGPAGFEDYKQCNPNVARRYFSSSQGVPSPPLQLLKKIKPPNGLRIFVMGGSTAAGFPYGNNVTFPKILEHQLQKSLPNKEVEVINVAMAAVNSYTILDLIDEVLEESPDAILIYAGHNEFYGALGVGSVQSLGNWRSFVRNYIKLHSFKTFVLLKDIITSTRNFFNNNNSIQDETSANTLMERIVGEQTIPLNGELYNLGKKQFEENLELIVKKISEHKVPLFISELVSNIKDQKPFVSVEENELESADYFYQKAKAAERNENYKTAKFNYYLAKDLDALRFRGSEDFNKIIRNLSKQYGFALVKTQNAFEENSPNKIMGNNLFLEHLHPNKDGYALIAKTFYNSLINSGLFEDYTVFKNDSAGFEVYSTEFDSVYADIVIKHLKSGWPFVESKKNEFFKKFKPKNKLESLALKVMMQKNYNLQSAHLELAKHYRKEGKSDKCLYEYLALISAIPQEPLFYEYAATELIKQKKINYAEEILNKSLKYTESDFANKWIGQIALMKKDYYKSIKYLLKANHNDQQVLFNLSRAYYSVNEINSADKYLNMLANNFPNSKYIPYLYSLKKNINKNASF